MYWLCKRKNIKYFVPNTLLKEDVRNLTNHPQERILAVFKKAINEQYYLINSYLAKGVDLEKILSNKNMSIFVKNINKDK